MSIRALLRSFFQGISQTLVVSVVLLALFNSTIWAPALEASPFGAASSTSLAASPAAPAGSASSNPPPKSYDHPSSQLLEPKDAAAPSTAAVPAKIGTGAARKSMDAPQPSLQAVTEKLSAQSPVFIENRGQFDSRARFQVKGNGPTAWLTDDGIVFDLSRPAKQPEKPGVIGAGDSSTAKPQPTALAHKGAVVPDAVPFDHVVVTQKLVGANPHPVMEGRNPLPGLYNYFIGTDPNNWRTHVQAFSEVVYKGVWNGIDLKLYANGVNLEEEFIVHPGADPNLVRLAYEGTNGLTVSEDGSLNIQTALGAIIEAKPNVYQETAGQRAAVSGEFKLADAVNYGFAVGEHQSESDLIIDPTLLFSTFLGGSGGVHCCSGVTEYATGIVVDASGSAYVTGTTGSTDFPVTSGAYQTVSNGGCAFVSKLSPLGDSLQYSTYLCGQTGVSGAGIGLDAAGNAYVAGNTQFGFPTTPNAFQLSQNGAFVTVLSANGDRLLYSSGFGSGATTHSIAVDSTGKAYFTGNSTGADCNAGSIPITSNAFQSSYRGCSAAFLAVLDPSQSGAASLVYGSYLGGSNSEAGSAIAVDAYGMAYLSGETISQDFPITPGAFQTAIAGVMNLFIAKLNPYAPSGPASLLYSTYLGGGNEDWVTSIAVDSLGNASLTGFTTSQNFPTTPGSLPAAGNGSFVTKLNAAGNKLVFSTYWGGNQSQGNGIAIDTFGNVIVGGNTSGGLVVTQDAFQSTYGGNNGIVYPSGDAFLSKFDAGGSLIYSSYLGGSSFDVGQAVAVDAVGDAYLAGYTGSFDFPTTPFAFQPGINPGGNPADDAFITKFPISGSGTLSIRAIVPNIGGSTGSVTAQILGTGFRTGANVKLSGACGTVSASQVEVGVGGELLTSTFDLTGNAPGPCDLTVQNPDGTKAALPSAFTVQQGGTADLRVRKFTAGAVPGLDMTYVATITNVGNEDASNLLAAETLDPWFTYLNSSATPTSIIQDDAAWPPSNVGTGAKYDAQLQWAISSLPVGSKVFSYTVNLDKQVPLGEFVEGGFCVGRQSLAVASCYGLNFFACDAAFDLVCEPALPAPPVYFACLATGLQVCHTALHSCLDKASDIHGDLCYGATTQTKGSLDPNELAGIPGIGIPGWVSVAEPLTYIIRFANVPTATAPVQRAVVTNPLNIVADDIQTLTMLTMTVARHQVSIPANFNPLAALNQFDTNLDLRPAKNLFVQIHVGMDTSTGLITWIFQSIDPTTGLPPTDPTVGFLDPGASVSLFFTVKPKAGLPTATQISDQATITFDANQPMSTAAWTNTLDNNAPVSHVGALPATESCSNFKVQWSGSDVGAGTQDYTVYSSDNGAGFVPWLTSTNTTSSVFQAQVGHSYGFYSIARDLVGNVEPGKTSAEATTRVASASSCGPPSLSGAASVVSYVNSTLSLNLAFTNIGTSDALNTRANTLTFRTLGGAGAVTLTSPQLPFIVGTVSVDNTITIPLTLNVPTTVTKFSMTEGGTMQDSTHKSYSFSIGQNVVPK